MDSQGVKFDGWPHVIFAQQFSRKWLEEELFPLSREMKSVVRVGGCRLLYGKRGVSYFYQPSTRTAGSFAFAIDYLGGRMVFSTENAREFSSAKKGETLSDTIKVINRYKPDFIVLRYDRAIKTELTANLSSVPIINAGDRGEYEWSSQHPTQAFLDIFTIQEKLGHIDGVEIAMVGDLINGRTVRSLSYLLGKFKDVKIHFISPQNAGMRSDVKEYLKRHDVWFDESNDLRQMAPYADVIYQTRTQSECGTSFDRNNHDIGYFVVNKDVLSMMKKDAIIMHPLPRVEGEEITSDVDEDPRAVYLTDQIDSGLYTRMALLKMILAPNLSV